MLENTVRQATLDTGAERCLIRQDILDECKRSIKATHNLDITHIRGVSGKLTPIKNKVTLSFKIGGLEVVQDFYSLDNMSHSILLGMDFLTAQKAILNCENQTLEIQNGITAVSLVNTHVTNTQSNDVLLAHNVTLPANTKCLVSAKLSNVTRHVSDILIEPNPKVTKFGVLAACCLTKAKNDLCNVEILNASTADIQLPASTNVGTWSSLSHEQVIGELNTDSTRSAKTNVNTADGSCDNDSCDVLTSNTVCKQESADCEITGESRKISNCSANADKTDQYIQTARDLGFDLKDSDLTESQKLEFLAFLGKNRDVFAKDVSELGRCDLYQYKIDTGDAPPVRQRFYRTSPAMKKEISRQIDDLEKHGLIEKCESDWTSPIVMVKKKDNTRRFAGDYRKINLVTKVISHPLARYEDVFDAIGSSEAAIYSMVDMACGFWQLKLDPSTKHKSAFITHQGVYCWNVLPFGLVNSSAIFGKVMSQVLRGLEYKTLLIYCDDCVIFSKDAETHKIHLQQVFDLLRKANLKLKPSKCQWAAKEVNYLGFRLSKNGIQADPAKTEVIRQWPQPKNESEIRAFLGVANFYRRFCAFFSDKAAPMTHLLKKGVPFVWSNDCETSFQAIKKSLTNPPTLRYANFEKEFILYTDSSSKAISYILGQRDEKGREVAICFAGRSLSDTERRYPVTHQEAFALLEGIKHYHVYLSNKPFVAYVDHAALEFLKDNKTNSGRLLRWALKLQQYSFKIIHKKGTTHTNADGLSRRPYEDSDPPPMEIHSDGKECADFDVNIADNKQTMEYRMSYEGPDGKSLSLNNITPFAENDKVANILTACADYESSEPVELLMSVLQNDTKSISELQMEDADLNLYINYLQKSELPDDDKLARKIMLECNDYVMDREILYHIYYPRGKGHKSDRVVKQLVVPKSLRDDVLLAYHDALMSCHQGIERTFHMIRLKYFWTSMYNDIDFYVRSCQSCQQNKRQYHAQRPPQLPIPPNDIFSRVHMDILGPLTATPTGDKYILLITCSFSKWVEAIALKSIESAEIARQFYNVWICRYGAPDALLTDLGKNFVSNLMKSLCNIFQITKINTSAYHPQTNSACERFNSVIAQSLRAYCNEKHSNWPDLVQSVMMAFRRAPSTQSSDFAPFFLLFGREMRIPIDTALLPPNTLPQTARSHLEKILQSQQISRDIAKENIEKAQQKSKEYVDKKAKTPEYRVGDRVWLMCSTKYIGLSPKLCSKYIGPYYICIANRNFTYKLRRCSDNKLVRSVINAIRLKPYIDDRDRPTNIPPQLQNAPAPLNPEEFRPDEVDENNLNTQQIDSTQDTDQPNGTQSQNTQSQQQNTDVYPVKKLIKSAMIRGVRHYYVQWDADVANSWEPVHHIPDALVREFHIKHYQEGSVKDLQEIRHVYRQQ